MTIGMNLFNIKYQKTDSWYSMQNKAGDHFVNFLANRFPKVLILAPQMFQKWCVSCSVVLFMLINIFRTSLHCIRSCPISFICCHLWRNRIFNLYWSGSIDILALCWKLTKFCQAIFILKRRIWFILKNNFQVLCALIINGWFFIEIVNIIIKNL